MSGNIDASSSPLPLAGPAARLQRAITIGIVGDAGAGKTTLLQETFRWLRTSYRVGAVVVNPKADRDATKLRQFAHYVTAIESQRLESGSFRQALKECEAQQLELLFLESSADRAFSDIPTDARVSVFSISGGDDKAVEFPQRVADADVLLLNKLDLLPHVTFRRDAFQADVRRINPSVRLLEVSASSGDGMEKWISWVRNMTHRSSDRNGGQFEVPELYLG